MGAERSRRSGEGRALAALALAGVLMSATVAEGRPSDPTSTPGTAPDRDPASAGEIFKAGHKLLKAGDWDGACSKFETSFTLNPTASILLNIARCHEHQGKLTLALSDYENALVLNRETVGEKRKKELDKVASEGLESVQARVPRLRILVLHLPPGLKLMRDGKDLPVGALGEPLLLDPGPHEIVAMAPGFVPEKSTTTLEEGQAVDVLLELKRAPLLFPSAPPAPPARPPLSGVPTWAWVSTAGAGAVMTGVGVSFLVDGHAAVTIIDSECPVKSGIADCPRTKPRSEVASLNSRKNMGHAAGALLTPIGGALLVGGVMIGLVKTRLGRDQGKENVSLPVLWVSPRGGGFGIEGAF